MRISAGRWLCRRHVNTDPGAVRTLYSVALRDKQKNRPAASRISRLRDRGPHRRQTACFCLLLGHPALDRRYRTSTHTSPRARCRHYSTRHCYPALGDRPLPPGELETAFRFANGPVAQPASHDGHAVKEELLIIALALLCVSNGASPPTWYAMKLVPHAFAFAAVHAVVFPPPTRGALDAMTDGSELEVIAGHGDVLCLPLATVPVGSAVGSEGAGGERRARGVELAGASIADLGTGRLRCGQGWRDGEDAVVGVAPLSSDLVGLDLPDRARQRPGASDQRDTGEAR